jgi:hypothetical protein
MKFDYGDEVVVCAEGDRKEAPKRVGAVVGITRVESRCSPTP